MTPHQLPVDMVIDYKCSLGDLGWIWSTTNTEQPFHVTASYDFPHHYTCWKGLSEGEKVMIFNTDSLPSAQAAIRTFIESGTV